MATVTAKIDSKELPAIIQWLQGQIGGQSEPDNYVQAPSPQPSSVADLFSGGQDAAPPDNYVMRPDANLNPSGVAFGDTHPSVKKKLHHLQDIMQGIDNPGQSASPQSVPQNFEGMPLPDYQPPDQPDVSTGSDPNAMPPAALSDTSSQPTVKGSWFARHPGLTKLLQGGLMLTEGGLVGSEYANAGQGFQAAQQQIEHQQDLPVLRLMRGQDIAAKQADINYKNAQTKAASQIVTIQTPQGPVTGPLSQLKIAFPAMFAAQSREKVATINASSRADLAQLKQDIDGGKIKWIKPAVDDQGQAVLGAYNENGQLVKYLPNSIGPAWLLPTERSSVRVVVDDQGNYHYIPVTSTTVRKLPPDGHGRPPQLPAPQVSPGAAPSIPPSPQALGNTRPVSSGGARPVRAGNTRPVMENGQPLHGPKAIDAGYAFDPQSDNWILTTRSEYQGNGLTNFTKANTKQITDDRRMITRLQDVERKTDRYANDFNVDISPSDRASMSAIIADDRLHIGISSTHIPTGWLGKLTDSGLFQGMSKSAQQRTIDYFQMREAVAGYNTVYTGSSRSSEKLLELQHDAMPNPLWKPDAAQLGFQRWNENLTIAKRGLPVIPGVNDGRETQLPPINGASNGGANPQGMITVQIPGQPQGQIPVSAKAAFLKKHPNAKVF